ncbi:MAG: DUF4833 domain-containing protein [Tannerellaceae bacterium]|nr:DUF4833 domain-containing protein [Tannerellaceae bacterium]
MKIILFFCLLLVFPANLFSKDNIHFAENKLFHIARSKNKNLVCYDVNYADGKLDAKNPLTVYWLNMEDKPGETSNLNMIQKKLAYGYKIISQSDDSCKILLNAYPERILTICKQDSKYVCLITINKQTAILQSLYVKAKPTNSLIVEYIELQGISSDAKQPVLERIENTKE